MGLGFRGDVSERRLTTHRSVEHADAVVQPQRIDAAYRVPVNVCIRIYAAGKPYWIRLHISPCLRIIISEVVVIEAGLRLEILPRISQIVDKCTLI